MISRYPDFSPLVPEQRPLLHPLFQQLPEGLSELTFAGLYLFREIHAYAVSRLDGDNFVISGRDAQEFFILPFALPEKSVLDDLFSRFAFLKAATETQAEALASMGFRVEEDRDNFDYLYLREELRDLAGRKFHDKKNLVNRFLRSFNAEGKPLLENYVGDALAVLDAWRAEKGEPGDYAAAREALERMEELQLCGGIYYVDGKPVACTLGEEVARGISFAIHFEKAVRADEFRGIYQWMNQVFASILPDKYKFINREQDLGIPGLRRAKESYNPAEFVKKFRAFPARRVS
jgi:hypothetical protein